MTFQEAKEAANVCRFMRDEIPDGMWPEVDEAIQAYKDGRDKTAFAESMEEILKDWGFSF